MLSIVSFVEVRGGGGSKIARCRDDEDNCPQTAGDGTHKSLFVSIHPSMRPGALYPLGDSPAHAKTIGASSPLPSVSESHSQHNTTYQDFIITTYLSRWVDSFCAYAWGGE